MIVGLFLCLPAWPLIFFSSTFCQIISSPFPPSKRSSYSPLCFGRFISFLAPPVRSPFPVLKLRSFHFLPFDASSLLLNFIHAPPYPPFRSLGSANLILSKVHPFHLLLVGLCCIFSCCSLLLELFSVIFLFQTLFFSPVSKGIPAF